MSQLNPELSVIIPSYSKAKVIEETLLAVAQEMQNLRMPFEIIVVVDGDGDQTSEILSNLSIEELTYHVNPVNRGKGNAIRLGVSLAKSEKYFALLDADLDLSPVTVGKAIDVLEFQTKIGLVLGSKFHTDSTNNYSRLRKIQSKAYSRLIAQLFDIGVTETQTGIKIGRMPMLKAAIRETTTDGFAFDLELLLELKKIGCKFHEIPVVLNPVNVTTVNLKTSANALRETFIIYRDYLVERKRKNKCHQ